MSAFSERLNKYVEKNALSKNQLINKCAVNRSTFYKCLKGDRAPTEKLLRKLIWELQLTPGEEEELRRLYHIAVIGDEVYSNRQCAKRCLETLDELSGELVPPIHQFQGRANQITETTLLQGENQVFQELCHLVQAEAFLPAPRINLFLPQRNSPFFEYLKALFRNSEGKDLRLSHLVQFSDRKEEKVRESLEFFDLMLYFLATNCTGYDAYYYYAETNFADTVGILYPYYVSTSTGLVLLNESLDRGIYTSNPVILDAWRSQFEDAVARSRPFLNAFEGARQITSFALSILENSDGGYQFFATPSFGPYLTREMMKRCNLAGAEMEDLFSRYFKGCELTRQSVHPFISFCSEEGLMQFARDGIMAEFPIELVPPLCPEDRKLLLERFLYDSPSSATIYLMDTAKIQVSNEFIFFLGRNYRIQSYRRELPDSRIFSFEEQNLLDAFDDFFRALPDSEYVLPREKLEQVLRAAIQCCDQQIAEQAQS